MTTLKWKHLVEQERRVITAILLGKRVVPGGICDIERPEIIRPISRKTIRALEAIRLIRLTDGGDFALTTQGRRLAEGEAVV